MFRRKKALALLMSAAVFVSLTACNGTPAESEPTATASASAVPVDRPNSVTISKNTADIIGTDIAATAKAMGLDSAVRNDDGSYTVQMTDDEKSAITASLRESLDTALEALATEGAWPFLTSVTVDATCKNARIVSDKALYTAERDDAVVSAVYIPALLYVAFTGGDADSLVMHFTVLDADGTTVLNEFDYSMSDKIPVSTSEDNSEPEE